MIIGGIRILALAIFALLAGAGPLQAQTDLPEIAKLELAMQRLLAMIKAEPDLAKARVKASSYVLLDLRLRELRANVAKANAAPPPATPRPEPSASTEAPPSLAETPPVAVPSPPLVPLEPSPPTLPAPAETPPATETAEVQPLPEPVAPPALPPAPEIPPWLFRASVIAAVGYHENLLHSAFNDLNSASLLGEFEATALNTKREQHRTLGVARYSRTHFLEEPDIRDEDLILLLGRYEYRLAKNWWAGVHGNFLRVHQPIDALDLIDPDASAGAPLTFQQIGLGPVLAWEPSAEQSLTLELGFRHEDLSEITQGEDYGNEQWFLSLDYRREWAEKHMLRLGYDWANREYAQRRQRQANGAPIPGSDLEITSHEFEAVYRYSWLMGESRLRWSNGARYRLEQDNGGGYDDVNRLDLYTRLEAGGKKWRVSGEVGWNEYQYDARLVSATSAHRRERSSWYGRLEGTYPLTEQANFWLRYEQRDHTGNRSFDHYGYRKLSTGIQFVF